MILLTPEEIEGIWDTDRDARFEVLAGRIAKAQLRKVVGKIKAISFLAEAVANFAVFGETESDSFKVLCIPEPLWQALKKKAESEESRAAGAFKHREARTRQAATRTGPSLHKAGRKKAGLPGAGSPEMAAGTEIKKPEFHKEKGNRKRKHIVLQRKTTVLQGSLWGDTSG